MYNHILLPTDGTTEAQQAVKSGIAFAKSFNAKITGLYVAPYPPHYEMEDWQPLETLWWPQYEETNKELAKKYLAFIEDSAGQEGVACECTYVTSDFPAEEIIKTAENKDCDLIFMASHGRRGLVALLTGSVTSKVLAHAKIPVLVYRQALSAARPTTS